MARNLFAEEEQKTLGRNLFDTPAIVNEGDAIDAIVEPVKSIGANVIGSVGSGLGGIYELIATGDTGRAAEAVRQMQANIQQEYAPQTESGKRGLENVAKTTEAIEENILRPALAGTAGLADVALNPVSNISQGFEPAKQSVRNVKESGVSKSAGAEVLELTGSPLLATAVETFGEVAPDVAGGLFALSKVDVPKFKFNKKANPTQARIAEEIKAGTADVDLVKKMVDESGKIVKDKKAIETIKQGFDDGVIAVVKGSSPVDKRRMLQMVKRLEAGKKNAKFAAENRPADIVGESLLKQVAFVKKSNTDAGKQLNRVATRLKGQKADITSSIDSFIKDAEDMGVSFNNNLIPNFEGSTIETIAPAKKLIKDIALKIRRNPEPDAFDAHQFKKFIDENVTFGKAAKGLGGKTESIAKKLRSSVNESLGDSFPEYREANAQYADTINILDSIQDASGSKVNLFGPNSERALGTVLRRLMSNTQSRVNLMDSIKGIKDISHKYGGSFDDDILSQVLFSDELDSMFNTAGRTTFAGQVQRGTKKALETAGGEGGVFRTTVDLAADAAEKLRGINEKNAIKAIKDLLEEK